MSTQGDSNFDEIERMAEVHSTMLLRVAAQQLGTQSYAEDVVQSVFLKMLQKPPKFVDSEHEKAWLIRVTINHCRDYLRTAWVRKTEALQETLPAKTKEKHTDVLEAVRSLPQKYSTPIFLYYYEGYPTADIAKILQMPKNTVESHLHRARAKLKKILGKEWEA